MTKKPHATAQQRSFVPAGSPLAIEVDEGLLERGVLSRPTSPSRASGRSRSSSPLARSRPVGARRSASSERRDYADSDSDGGYESDTNGEGGRPSYERTASHDEWDNLRDGSIARRKAWRRPSTRWVLPFITAITFSLGVTTAPRAELIVDMACLVNPPRTPSNAVAAAVSVDSMLMSRALAPMTGQSFLTLLEESPGAPVPAEPVTPREPLSPAARWFLDAQRAIHDRLHPLPGGPSPDNSSTHPYPEIDPKLCKEDPGVASAAAQLTKIITMTAGLLSALTTGFWAGVSDKVGRRKIMAVVALGLLLNDVCFLFFASNPWLLMRSRMYVLLIGPILDGVLGGLSTVTATIHAYVSDVTPNGSRATVFAQVGGALMLGLLFGPVTSSFLVYATGNILFPFYVSIGLTALIAVLFRFLLPESLSSESRLQLSKKAKLASERRREREQAQVAWERAGPRRLALEADGDPSPSPAGDSGFSLRSVRGMAARHRTVRRGLGTGRRLLRKSVWFLEPLAVLVPEKAADGRRDWNLTITAGMLFLGSWIMGVLQIKFMYAFYAFGWGTAEFGPYLSFIALCRMTVLLGLMPAAMYFLKPYFTARAVVEPVSADVTETSPLLSTSALPGEEARGRKADSQPRRTASLDLFVVRVCLTIEVLGLLALGLNAQNSAVVFIVASAVLTLGSPGNAACNSLALSFLKHQRDAGTLFGALAVLSALGSALLSPMIMANVFSATVAVYAPAIFLCAAGIIVLALVLSFGLRLDRPTDEERGRGRATDRSRSRSRTRVRQRASRDPIA